MQKKSRTFMVGLLLGGVGAAGCGYLLNVAGLLVVTGSPGSVAVRGFQWLYANLGFSLIPFILALAGYGWQLRRLRLLLESDNADPQTVLNTESKVDLMTSVFFGIGVTWTAIGMRNGLLAGLGDLDAATAASKGSWYILNQLIDGGILLALSTTIAGGIGGYVMRCIKTWLVGAGLHEFYENLAVRPFDEVIGRMQKIVDILETSTK